MVIAKSILNIEMEMNIAEIFCKIEIENNIAKTIFSN